MSEKIRVLMVSGLSRRENQIAYVGDLINSISAISNELLELDVFVSAQGAYVNDGELDVNKIICVKVNKVLKWILNIPKLRVPIWSYYKHKSFRRLLKQKSYDFIVFHSVQIDTDALVIEAKRTDAKIVIFPWGSDVLRASKALQKHIQECFSNADYIRGDNEDFIKHILEIYPNINPQKFVNITYASPAITYIEQLRNCKKEELFERLPLPTDRYYIVCGYSANKGQQHKKIIEQIASIKNELPKNYLLVFPISYGKEYGISKQEIVGWCDSYGLSCFCIDGYISDSQMACLHLLTDILIHVQVTDLANSFIDEAVFAGTKIINGSWLHYPNLEKYGYPYRLCDSIEDLSDVLLSEIDSNKERIINTKLYNSLSKMSWPCVAKDWVVFFSNNN